MANGMQRLSLEGQRVGGGRAPLIAGAALLGPGAALLAASVLLPALLFGLAAWKGYDETLHEAEVRVERTARILEEHAVKVFETHHLVIEQVRERAQSVDWTNELDRARMFRLLRQFQDDLDQIATITIVDSAGRMRVGGRSYPPDASLTFEDRDWFQAAKRDDRPFVSRSYRGRQTGQLIFNVARRNVTGPDEAFDGAIALSVDRGYFEKFYQTVDETFDHSVLLVRADGEILAHEPPTGLTHLSAMSRLLREVARRPVGIYTDRSTIDGVERVFGYRKVKGYPVYVRYGISKLAALAPWRANLLAYGIVAALASLALSVTSGFALRQTRREKVATQQWREAAAELQDQATERERVEAQLRQLQKMEAVGRLTGGIAHDFNNLLTAVIGNIDLARRRLGPEAPTARLLANAMDGAHRAAVLTNRLLAFSRRQPLDPRRIEANELIEGMSDLFRRTLGETVAVRTLPGAGLWPTLADPNQLESAILNLAVNARDAMPNGGRLTIGTAMVTLDAADAARQTDVTAGDYVCVSVADTGIGMSREVLANAFEPFFTTKPVGKGTGLGLSQVYGFAKQSGGHVAIESEPGAGTVVRLHLPRLVAEAAAAEAAPSTAVADLVPDAHGATILVVEDEEIVRRTSVAALREAGYDVVEAADGPQGLALLTRDRQIALLFTDIVLTGPMDGPKLAVAAHRLRPDLPVLFTTGYAPSTMVPDERLDRAADFIGKPFTTGALAAKVREMLDAAAAGRALAG